MRLDRLQTDGRLSKTAHPEKCPANWLVDSQGIRRTHDPAYVAIAFLVHDRRLSTGKHTRGGKVPNLPGNNTPVRVGI